ncbi:lysophospholipid acyltransferase family protein [Chitinimonas lacunae]|uniref:1-acyl-sn-glycerol-3-phosphate acyltransferase n=1 Tax=Chitinimonas lacunae TaxID=1963018 RepID=A0ABV8MNL1_9NEIS
MADGVNSGWLSYCIPMPKSSLPVRIWRFLRLVFHLLAGVIEVGLYFPGRSAMARRHAVARWSRRLVSIAAIEVRAQGHIPAPTVEAAILVANHVSWLDIFVMNAVVASRFVAKSEVRNWPLIGWLCERTGTLFISRERRQDAARVNQAIAGALNDGDCVAVFPEGSTSDGFTLKPFNAALLQPAVQAGAPIIPVALRYLDAYGRQTDIPAYVDDLSLVESVLRILAQRRLIAELTFLSPLPADGRHRRELAKAAEAAIAEVLSPPPAVPAAEKVSEIRAGLPA